MRASLLAAQKDLVILFRSPLAYILMACFLFIAGYFFASGVGYYQLVSLQMMQMPEAATFTPQELLVGPYLQNAGVILLFFLPLLTMRGFSEEKRMGTFELLMSYPLREAQLAGGKLLALSAFLALLLALSAVGPLALFIYTAPEFGPFLVGYLGLFLLSASFASLGLFLSSLTENQIVSAALTFASLLFLWLISWVKEIVPKAVQPLVEALSLLSHFESFTKGVLVFSDLIYYLAFTAAFLWFTVLSLENQRWRA